MPRRSRALARRAMQGRRRPPLLPCAAPGHREPGQARSRRPRAAAASPAAAPQKEVAAALRRALPRTTGRDPAPWLLWSSVSVEISTQPLQCLSTLPVGRSTLLQPPPCRSCGGRLGTGPLRRSATHDATMSAGVAPASASRQRHHRRQQPWLSTTSTRHKRSPKSNAHPGCALLLLLF